MQDKIEKVVELKAPVARVWKAVTDHEEFGAWFRVKLEGPFVVGEVSRGQITYPGYEHLKWEATVKTMNAEKLFAYTWCPDMDLIDLPPSEKPQTLVEFKLEPTATGTRLVITESGFDAMPDPKKRDDAMRRNEGGWDSQTKNISDHIEQQ